MPPNIEQNIKNEYNMLSLNEIRLCCLLLFNVTYSDIADILPFTQKSAHTIAHRIKQKTGMNDIKDNLKKLLIPEVIS